MNTPPVAPTSPLAIAMWDFSWLTRRSADEAEYVDWDRVLDELCERGYDCIRLDAFPHLIGRDDAVAPGAAFKIAPLPVSFPWGCHATTEVVPATGLVTFLRKMKDRGLRAGLSTWLIDDESHQRLNVVEPGDFARIWLRTLRWLAGHDLLDIVEWVDLCNEFPMPQFMPMAYQRIFGGMPESLYPFDMLESRWPDEAIAAASTYLIEPLAALKAEFPGLRYTASFTSFGKTQLGALDLREFTILEPHIWLAEDRRWSEANGQARALMMEPDGVRAHAAHMQAHWPEQRAADLALLRSQLDFWQAAGRAKELPLFTSEAWGPINYHDLSEDGLGGEWDWVKDVCAEGVFMAIDRGWRGICTSNFCQPHFKGMWHDIAWHQRLTSAIRSGPEPRVLSHDDHTGTLEQLR